MRQLIAIFIIVFVLVWGLGVFIGYLSGFKRIQLPQSPSNQSGPALLDEQKKITTESEESRNKLMQDYQYQLQRYKGTSIPLTAPR